MGVSINESKQLLSVESGWFYSNATIVSHASSSTSHTDSPTSHHRIILKNGECNIYQPVTKPHQKLLIFHNAKLVDSSWTFTLTFFMVTLLISWLIFAILYWLICFVHGDLEPNHLPEMQKKNNFKPCIYNVHNFASCYLFSIETQHTVGYGNKATTDECPEAIFVTAVQCLVGFMMQGFMAVVIFTKMTLPRLRSKTLLFSKHAVIYSHQSQLRLAFRVGDMRKNHLINPTVRAFMVRTTRTKEGEKLEHTQQELSLRSEGVSKRMFFNWPLTMEHVIDEQSPLYGMGPGDFSQNSFELMVVLEGVIESTDQLTQAKSSYLSTEILWGRKFQPMMKFNECRNEFGVDFSRFDKLSPVYMPLPQYSAENHELGSTFSTGLG